MDLLDWHVINERLDAKYIKVKRGDELIINMDALEGVDDFEDLKEDILYITKDGKKISYYRLQGFSARSGYRTLDPTAKYEFLTIAKID